MLLYDLFEDVHCISAHVRFSVPAHDRFRDKYKFVTILRDPVARFLSNYTWSYGKADAHARIEEPFREFLRTDRAARFGATYVEFFCGLPKSADITSSEAIEAAIANLAKFDVVGRLDDLAGFEAQIEQALGIRLRVGHENRATRSSGASDALSDPELRAEVTALCAPDLAVWNGYLALQGRPPVPVPA